MNARNRLYIIISLSIGAIFLILAIVLNQFETFAEIRSLTQEQVQEFLDGLTHGFPRPWE